MKSVTSMYTSLFKVWSYVTLFVYFVCINHWLCYHLCNACCQSTCILKMLWNILQNHFFFKSLTLGVSCSVFSNQLVCLTFTQKGATSKLYVSVFNRPLIQPILHSPNPMCSKHPKHKLPSQITHRVLLYCVDVISTDVISDAQPASRAACLVTTPSAPQRPHYGIRWTTIANPL